MPIVLKSGILVPKIKDGDLKILLVNGFGDKFGIPKGHKKESEPLRECAKREVYEETSVICEILKPLNPCGKRNTETGNVEILFPYIGFQLNPNDKLIGDGENEVIDFFPIEDLPPLKNCQSNMIYDGIIEILKCIKQ